jgi:hypothetical protein
LSEAADETFRRVLDLTLVNPFLCGRRAVLMSAMTNQLAV